MRNLTIDPEFRDKIPPLTPEEFSKLEQNILEDGEVREPLVVWKNTIIDGHHRWKIIQEHPEIPFKIKQMDFPGKWSAIAWMCSNQLGRRNLSTVQHDKLIQEEHDAMSKSIGGQACNRNAEKRTGTKNLFVSKSRNTTRSAVAAEHGISESHVKQAVEFGRGLEAAEKVSPGIKDAVLSGNVKAPKKVIAGIRKLSAEKQKEAVGAILQNDVATAKQIVMPSPEKETPADTPDFTVEDLAGLLDATMKALDSSLKLHLVLTHNDMLKSKDARDAANKALSVGQEILDKYKNMISEVAKNGN